MEKGTKTDSRPNLKHKLIEIPLNGYGTLRTLHFSFQFRTLSALNFAFTEVGRRVFSKHIVNQSLGRPPNLKRQISLWQDVMQLIQKDSANIAQGVYPLSVLRPESPLEHSARLPKLFFDNLSISWRRFRNKTKVFNSKAKNLLEDLPDYYRRNFHFQTDGYLSPWSAELYEHQVELLFGGSADAMRRLILKPLKEKFKNDGESLRFLEIGCGTGRSTRFLRLCFPKARIVAVDLSYPYLKQAQKKLESFNGIDFLQADGAELPFSDQSFDAACSVFMFHELPLNERHKVLKEVHRVLKPKGFLALVDSIQKDDVPNNNSLLDQFPQDFHESFYKNYVNNRIEDALKKAKFKNIQSSCGFVSKATWGDRA